MGFISDLLGRAKAPARPEALEVEAPANAVLAPVGGRVERNEDIPDPVFAGEVMGRTVAIWPSEGRLFSPVTGSVMSAMPHAIGIAADDGVEVLMHVGIDTVEMAGDGFELFARQGDHVRAGEALMRFDRDKIEAAGKADIIMTIVTNSDAYPELACVGTGEVAAGEKIITCA